MTARTVTCTVRAPASAVPRSRAGITIELVRVGDGIRTAGFLGDRRRAVGRTWVQTDNTGVWACDLEPNAGTGVASPPETIYRITEHLADGTEWTYYILVPDVAGPHEAADIEVDADGVPTGANDNVMRFANGAVMRYEDGTAMRYDT